MAHLLLFVTTAGTTALLLLASGCRSGTGGDFQSDRAQCQKNIRALENAVKEYTFDNEGRFPASLEDALANIGFDDAKKSAHMLRCPGSYSNSTTATDLASKMGYVYVDWSKSFDRTNAAPESYPLIYDRFMQNHDGRGVNVISVGGEMRWDEGAAWLRGFISQHRGYHLLLPQ